jgi:DNA-binding SARP family transcriptional activator
LTDRTGQARSRLTLLGHWGLWLQGRSVPATINGDGRRVLTLITMQGPLSRGVIRQHLWPDVSASAAASRLRTALWRLSPVRDDVLADINGTLRLRPDVVVDVDELVAAAAEVDDGLDPDPHRFEADLLPDWDEDWLVVDRERIRQIRLHALEQLSGRQLAQERYAAALDSALVALQADPLRESAHRAVIAVHLAEHNFSEAIAQYLRCCAVLDSELGVPPSCTLRGLMADGMAQLAGEKK